MASSTKSNDLQDTMRGPAPQHGSGRKTIDFEPPSPSASVLLISPTNRILLLHRVRNSTSFASAHVFPGGHLSPQDGNIPPQDDARRHEDSEAYRVAAIRECFEESGLLLARCKTNPKELVQLSPEERDQGRKAVHSEEIPFRQWVEQKHALLDVEGLAPFTRWLTPSNVQKRFSTQMYLYFLPLESPVSSEADRAERMHIPTPDGGVEHTAAQFLYPQEWLDQARSGDIVLYPPQFFLLSLIAPFLFDPAPAAVDKGAFIEQRNRLMNFVNTDGDPSWGEKCISPNPVKKSGKYFIMGLGDPGPELEGTSRRGDLERVIKIELSQDMDTGRGRRRPQPQEVAWRRDILKDGKVKL